MIATKVLMNETFLVMPINVDGATITEAGPRAPVHMTQVGDYLEGDPTELLCNGGIRIDGIGMIISGIDTVFAQMFDMADRRPRGDGEYILVTPRVRATITIHG